MTTPDEALDAAKLATLVESSLRTLDSMSDSNIPANRIDKRRFIENVIRSAKGGNVMGANVRNSDEAAILEVLNREAMQKIPDIAPQMIPMPPQSNGTPLNLSQQMSGVALDENFIKSIKNIENMLEKLCEHFIENGGKIQKKKKLLEEKKLPKVGEKLPVISQDDELKLLEEIKKEDEVLKKNS